MDPTAHLSHGYSAKLTAEVVGITYRQLDYWARTDLVAPSLAKAAGSGSRRIHVFATVARGRAPITGRLARRPVRRAVAPTT